MNERNRDNVLLLKYALAGFSIFLFAVFLGTILFKKSTVSKNPVNIGASKRISNNFIEGKISASLPWSKKIAGYLIFKEKELFIIIYALAGLITILCIWTYYNSIIDIISLYTSKIISFLKGDKP